MTCLARSVINARCLLEAWLCRGGRRYLSVCPLLCARRTLSRCLSCLSCLSLPAHRVSDGWRGAVRINGDGYVGAAGRKCTF